MNDSSEESRSARLKRLFGRTDPPVVLPSGVVPTYGRILEHVGYEAFFVGGGSTLGYILGRPDDGTVSMTESVMVSRWFADATSLPVLVDIDFGFGGPKHVHRAVTEYIRAGVAGVMLEDQLPTAKRFGGAEGKEVLDLPDAIAKLDAAVAARDEIDGDFQIIARCDARDAVNGNGVPGAIDRMRSYANSGADVVHYEGGQSLDELKMVRDAIGVPMTATDFFLPTPLTLSSASKVGLAAIFLNRPIVSIAKYAYWLYSQLIERDDPSTAGFEIQPDGHNGAAADDSLLTSARWLMSWTGSGAEPHNGQSSERRELG